MDAKLAVPYLETSTWASAEYPLDLGNRSDALIGIYMNAGVLYRQLPNAPCDRNVQGNQCVSSLRREPASFGADVVSYFAPPRTIADKPFPRY